MHVPRAEIVDPRLVGVAAGGARPGDRLLDARDVVRVAREPERPAARVDRAGIGRPIRVPLPASTWARERRLTEPGKVRAVLPHPLGVRRSDGFPEMVGEDLDLLRPHPVPRVARVEPHRSAVVRRPYATSRTSA